MQATTSADVGFALRCLRFDHTYAPAQGTRLTTNFANLARGSSRQQNLRNALQMIDNRFNELAHWDNPTSDRYTVELDIISVEMKIAADTPPFPAIETLKTTIVDRKTGKRTDGVVGNNFSSYVRDYDFSVLLPRHNQGREEFSLPQDFGELHGRLFQAFIASDVFKARFRRPPVICLSVSEAKTYRRLPNSHPILGAEFKPDAPSLTEGYFRKMGLQVRYFMPPKAVAPLAFYFIGDLLNDYSNLDLIGTISTMESFQRIYRPEIYNANSAAGECFRPSLKHKDFAHTQVVYDRDERSRLAVEQGQFAEEHFIKPHRDLVESWLDGLAA